jgi:two-component system response regulator FlrC
MTERVLVVDDEEGIRSFIQEVLEGEGLAVSTAEDGQAAAEQLERRSFHLMVTDLKMPRVGGMELLRRARVSAPEMEVIVLTAHGTVETAVEAMKLGAFEYLAKPLSGPAELRLLVERALERRRLREQGRRALVQAEGTEPVVARDPAMLEVIRQLRKVAPTQATVLLSGESGTGKEVAARMLHRESTRRDGPFVAVNCAAVSPQLVESEMFGHEKGAFTGAVERRRGRFELADGGTLFLDEVSELPPPLQAKLLRVLQERTFERVGGTRTMEVDVRVVAATNRDLPAEIAAGRFREDLYHRLAVFPVRLPPLRERPGDILPLAEHLLGRIGRELGKASLVLDDGARRDLAARRWPGNVRELGNALERAAIMAEGQVIGCQHLPVVSSSPATAAPRVMDGTLRDLEKEAIRQALVATGGHRKRAAERLGIGLRTLYDKLKEYGDL